MQQPTEGNGPHSAIRIIGTFAMFDAVVPPAVYREWPTSSVEGPRPAQQNDETNPMSIWERFAGRPVLEGWCWLSQNLRNEPNVNLDNICGLNWLVRGFHAPGKTTQTNPALPEWRPDRLRGRVNNGKRTQPCRNGSLSLGSPGEEARERSQPCRNGTPSDPSPGPRAREPSHRDGTDPRKARERSHRTRIDPGTARERSHGCTGFVGFVEFGGRAALAAGSGRVSLTRDELLRATRAEQGRVAPPSLPQNVKHSFQTPHAICILKRRPGPACIEHGPFKPAATLRGPGHDRPIPRQATTARHSQSPGEPGRPPRPGDSPRRPRTRFPNRSGSWMIDPT
jgi:hypothetical protein